ncbi:hypothetical protein [Virgibacillus ihumii]|uniref:hypothetical protein n=1 Tax=Virgibacillus ihumii TaxID=2686091 RepID=UPI00157D835F|nr:hypothetical protein [Virgibacillus ihumii]
MKLLKNLYGWTAFLTMFLGMIVTVLFVLSFLIGGESGEAIAVFAGKTMTWGIRLAAIAIFIGLIYTYIKREHTLTIKSESKESAQKEIDHAHHDRKTAY